MILEVEVHSELLSAQYLVRYLGPENIYFNITRVDPPPQHMKYTLYTSDILTIKPLLLLGNKKQTFEAKHAVATTSR